MPNDLRARLAAILAKTPAKFLADAGQSEMLMTFHGNGHGGHDYDGACALCRGEVDTLLDAIMAALKPATPLPPGTELLRVLNAMGMSQIQLAQKIGLSTKHVNQICSGNAALSYETAIKLEDVTSVPAAWWNAAEAAYRTALLRGVVEAWRGPVVAS